MKYNCTIAAIFLLLIIPSMPAKSQTNGNTPTISEQTASRAKDYFDVISQITMSLNGTKCEQIQRDIRTVNTPQNRMKMDFDLSSLPGAISQQIASQYQSDIQAYREANNNYLAVCKNDRYAAQANADLNELFKLSVAKADANYEKMKAESDKAMAEANKAKAEADKAKAEADKAKAEADNRRAQSNKAKNNTNTGYGVPTANSRTNQTCKDYLTPYCELMGGSIYKRGDGRIHAPSGVSEFYKNYNDFIYACINKFDPGYVFELWGYLFNTPRSKLQLNINLAIESCGKLYF